MVLIFILSLALFSGASTAFEFNDTVIVPNITTNASTLERNPWLVQVDFHNPWSRVWAQQCAAVVLNSRYVLSAASCFVGEPFYRRIRAGSNNRNTGGVIVSVQTINNYPLWNRTYPVNGTFPGNGTSYHDISVVRLAWALTLSNLIRQAPIVAPGSAIPSGLALNQLGWGLPLHNTTYIGLSSASVTLVPWSRNSSVLTASPSFAAQYNADFGSPWIIGNVTVGIFSGENYPTYGTWDEILFATSVTHYTNWIIRTAV